MDGLKKLAIGLLGLVLAVIGWHLSQSGFDELKQLRQIERLPYSTIASALPGEVKISAQVRQDSKLLTSEHFKRKVVYYRFLLEEERTDSDGDTYWATITDISQSVNFLLADQTGELPVNLETRTDSNLDFSLPYSDRNIAGGYRYTEWRIHPGDQIMVIGWLHSPESDGIKQLTKQAEIGFIKPGQYKPLISKYSESKEKSDIGLWIVAAVCGGISLIAFAALSLAASLSIHRLIAYLSILTFVVAVPLLHLGISMLKDDIVNAGQRIESQNQLARHKVNQLLIEKDMMSPVENNDWQNLSKLVGYAPLDKQTKYVIDDVMVNLEYSRRQFEQQLETFPNNLFAWLFVNDIQSIADLLDDNQQRQLQLKLQAFQTTQTHSTLSFAIGLGGLLVSLGLTWWGFRLIRLKRHIENIPTSKISGLVFGLSEIKGRIVEVEPEDYMRSPLTQSRCYWYQYKVEEKQRSGDKTRWVTIEKRTESKVFKCKDSSGEIKVHPQHAEVISQHKKTEKRGNRRYIEKTIKLSDKVYVLGYSKIDKTSGDSLEISGEKKQRPFLITNLTEQAVMMRKAHAGMFSLTAAFSTLMFAFLFYLGGQGNFSPSDYLLGSLIAPVYMSLTVLVLHYNDLIFLKQRAERNFANIKVSMQKRADLIPNLEKIVKQYFAHEKTLLTQVSELRSQFKLDAEDITEIEDRLSKEQNLLSSLIALKESSPDLNSDRLSLKLMNKLIDLENEVALMREGYNDAVTYYNTRIETIPDVFFARIFGFEPIKLMQFETKKFSRVEF